MSAVASGPVDALSVSEQLSKSRKPRILVVEDEVDIANLMRLHLNRQGYEVLLAVDGEQALSLLTTSLVDLVVLDWMLPGLTGLDLCQRLSGRFPVLMVTARAEASDIVHGLEKGADDYITKPFEIGVFLARVKALLRRSSLAKSPSPDEFYSLGELKVDLKSHKTYLGATEIPLTPSEFKLLVELLKNRGRVLSRKKLIELVHGEGVNVVDRVIDTLIFGLRQKLGIHGDLVETVRGVGYRVKPDSETHAEI